MKRGEIFPPRQLLLMSRLRSHGESLLTGSGILDAAHVVQLHGINRRVWGSFTIELIVNATGTLGRTSH